MHFVANRKFVLRSTKGHSIQFEKGEATYVPKSLHQEAMEKGCLPCDAEGKLIDEIAKAPAPVERVVKQMPADAETLHEEILAEMRQIVKDNRSEEFAGTTPSASVISVRLGYPVDQKEVRKVWELHRADLMNAAKE